MLICFPCLGEAQTGGALVPMPALTVYHGQAMCLTHLNLARGLPAEFGAENLGPSIAPAAIVRDGAGGSRAPQPPAYQRRPIRTEPPPPPPTSTEQAGEEGEEDLLEGVHEPCGECTRYVEVHYQPDVPHCGCGAPLIDGVCETQLQGDDWEHMLEGIRPR